MVAVVARAWKAEASLPVTCSRLKRHRPQGQPGGACVEVPGGQVGQRAGLPVGDDLLDHGMVAVVALGLQRLKGAVGEELVVAPGGEQLALLTHGGWFGQVTDAAHLSNHPFHFRVRGSCINPLRAIRP
ncbi:hypothetical protein [Actinomadura madurae]|uniref:hypothetical protein n=1 Tax=Actinomadura madurae TaxID=1993 RepID=UPI0011BF6E93|nr:hypothetical protein [Actinomadura madurae]